MAVITISRGSYSRGKEIAEKVAVKLGYECISRDLLLEVSKDHNIPELKLKHAIHDAFGILKRLNRKEEKYIAFIFKRARQWQDESWRLPGCAVQPFTDDSNRSCTRGYDSSGPLQAPEISRLSATELRERAGSDCSPDA